ncbi:SusD-like starch-binding protein associating with outer membrane [Chitinophaga niastensis]|uniref:SusD-like starch-binding protein associating with outer membrane n=1 Tax=Chitinophaga niastensis TaxID=536980 RepID=A0A2P8HPS6_CHINA|nr:RagB/SusD family nutrient uptake outer membrane protein [Chitinophaga niastensis]PSL48212.1 SusD-like starch-binding protein associating with outer membrane [Chitinophaga niastensis]
MKQYKSVLHLKETVNSKKQLFLVFCLISLLIVQSGCKKFVDVGVPKTQLATGTVFSENSTATAALTAIYAQMSSLRDICKITGLSSDEFINYAADPSYANAYKNALIENNATSLFWISSYNFIYQANAVIEGLQNNTGVSAAVKKQLTGEAKFIRAFWQFYLVNLYGDIPIVTSIDYTVNIKAFRSTKTQVYQQIIADLKDAQNLLGDNYVDAHNAITTDRVRPTKWVATALLARAYLYANDYMDAETQSTILINNTQTFSLLNTLNDVFLANSNEAIWEIMPPGNTGYNTDEGNSFILTDVPSPINGVSLSQQQLSVFEPGDKRRTDWVDSIIISGATYYFPYKYKIQTGGDIKEYSMMLRLAEQFLIRSEARIQQNKLSEGVADLNIIRNRAGLNNTAASTKTELLSAVMHERQVELFTEGYRWLDLKRVNIVDAVMNDATLQKGGGKWQSYQQLYPIPSDDIRNGINLKQNPGY